MAKSDFKNKTDEELMETYKMGEVAAFDILFERHSGQVLGYLSRKLSSSKEAQDVLQDVFFKLHRSRHQYNGTFPFAPWLFSIARSVWLDHVKKKNLEDLVAPEELDNLIAQPVLTSAQGINSDVLDRLPANQKEAVALRILDEATFEEIAIKLSTSPANARQLVSRGLKRLKGFLKVRRE